MNKFIKKEIFFILCLFSFIANGKIGFAQVDQLDNIEFSMSIIEPENQFDKGVTYFDIMVKPNDKQTLQIAVTNTSDTVNKVRVTPTNAITNSKGVIEYSRREEDYKYDETLKHPFTSLVSESQTVELKANETKILDFEFQAPNENFDGIILGGFLADLIDEETSEQEKKQSITFLNKFQLVKAVVIRNSDKKIEPNFKLNEIKPALYSHRTAVTANLQNTTPVLLGNVEIHAEISKKGSKDVLRSETKTKIQFAPNSNFDFPIMWDNAPLEPGSYTITLNLKSDNKEFDFTDDFVIRKSDSDQINRDAIDLETTKKDYTLVIILSAIFIIIIIGLIFIITLQRLKHKKNKGRRSKHKKK